MRYVQDTVKHVRHKRNGKTHV